MSDLATSISDAWRAQTRAEKSRGAPKPRTHCWASGWHPCHRKMCLDLTHPEDLTYDDGSLEAFAAGDAFERDARARLVQAGRLADPPFYVIRDQESIEIRDRSGRVVITGRTDGVVRWPVRVIWTPDGLKTLDGEQPDHVYAVLEIKGGNSVRGLETLDDFEASRWARGIPRQVAAYMLALGIRYGLLVLKQPSGAPNFVLLDLEEDRVLEMAEDHIAKATFAADYAEAVLDGAGEGHEIALPDYTDNPALCQICPHRGKSCAPPVDFGEGLQVIQDPGLIEAARDVAKNGEAAKKHDKGKKALAAALRPLPRENGGRVDVLCALGNYELRGALKRRGGGFAFSFDVVEVAKEESLP